MIAPARRHRVTALAPEDRRAALIAATIPLLREHGAGVSTRQIADAAGVAEGTIFGVFKDKASLLHAAVVSALDPGPLLRGLRAIDPDLPLRPRLVTASRLIREHVAEQGAIFFVVRSPEFRELTGRSGDREGVVEWMASRYLVLHELAVLMEPDARLLRRNPSTVARLLMALVGSPRSAFGMLDEHIDDEEVVSAILDGVLVHPGSA